MNCALLLGRGLLAAVRLDLVGSAVNKQVRYMTLIYDLRTSHGRKVCYT